MVKSKPYPGDEKKRQSIAIQIKLITGFVEWRIKQ